MPLLVSAILPTRGRREFARQAVACFLAQMYPAKELVIMDDADDPSFPDGCPRVGTELRWQNTSMNISLGIWHQFLPTRLSIPEKRNLCCERALGEIIWHLDSDDYSAPERMADQVQRLEESGLAMTGYHSMLFHREDGAVFKYTGKPPYAIGTSMCYRRSWWKEHPWFELKLVNSDGLFNLAAQKAGQLVSADAGQLMVARIHSGNTSRKPTRGGSPYLQVDASMLPAGFLEVESAHNGTRI